MRVSEFAELLELYRHSVQNVELSGPGDPVARWNGKRDGEDKAA